MSDSVFAIDVTGLGKDFGDKTVVDGVDLRLPKGQVWGFLGPNGSGKTTTIRMLCGLLQPTRGQGRCLGFDVLSQSREIKLRTGYMTQKFSFWDDLTIRENLQFVARLHGLKSIPSLVDTILEKLGLAHRQHQLAASLSGGWKQRLALAAVTMAKPQLLLLDEPTAGVDPQARRDFWDEIQQLTSDGMTVLLSTHYMDEAERCDQIVYLANGHLLARGSVEDIIRHTGIYTYHIQGRDLRMLAQQLRLQPEVANVSYFGSALHVSGTDQPALLQRLQGLCAQGQRIIDAPPELEDAFIALMQQAGKDQREYN